MRKCSKTRNSFKSDVIGVRAVGSNFNVRIYQAEKIHIFAGFMGEYAFYDNRTLTNLADSRHSREYDFHKSRSASAGLLLSMEYRLGNLAMFGRLNSTLSYITDTTYTDGHTYHLNYVDLSRSGIGLALYIF